jgi:hypothetical protein
MDQIHLLLNSALPVTIPSNVDINTLSDLCLMPFENCNRPKDSSVKVCFTLAYWFQRFFKKFTDERTQIVGS